MYVYEIDVVRGSRWTTNVESWILCVPKSGVLNMRSKVGNHRCSMRQLSSRPWTVQTEESPLYPVRRKDCNIAYYDPLCHAMKDVRMQYLVLGDNSRYHTPSRYHRDGELSARSMTTSSSTSIKGDSQNRQCWSACKCSSTALDTSPGVMKSDRAGDIVGRWFEWSV